MEELIEEIYNCAAEPELWGRTLDAIRDRFGAAYATVAYLHWAEGQPKWPVIAQIRSSEWDRSWFDVLLDRSPDISDYATRYAGTLDVAWTQMSIMREDDFHKTDFYLNWAAPQRLRDCGVSAFLHRTRTFGFFSVARAQGQPLLSREDAEAIESLAPHIRRAVAINAVVDENELLKTLLRETVDHMSSAVFIVGTSGQLVFANEAGEAMLSSADMLRLSGGRLVAHRRADEPDPLAESMERACAGDRHVGFTGIGVPLIGKNGNRAPAYVLPIAGSRARRNLGPGFCAVFVARGTTNFPAIAEILRTLFDLTAAEARVALLNHEGQSPAEIARSSELSIHTVRSHLAQVFTKMDVKNQVELVACINRLDPRLSFLPTMLR